MTTPAKIVETVANQSSTPGSVTWDVTVDVDDGSVGPAKQIEGTLTVVLK